MILLPVELVLLLTEAVLLLAELVLLLSALVVSLGGLVLPFGELAPLFAGLPPDESVGLFEELPPPPEEPVVSLPKGLLPPDGGVLLSGVLVEVAATPKLPAGQDPVSVIGVASRAVKVIVPSTFPPVAPVFISP